MRDNMGWIAVVALLSGCAPMEQAPLVYSSTKQFGIGVKSGAPDAPGLDVSIGFRALDAAYVPVAVAKECREKQDCTGIDYNVVPINGKNDVSGLSSVDEGRIANYSKTIDDGVRTIDERARRKSEISQQLADIADLPNKRARVAQLETPLQAVPPGVLTAAEESELVQLKAQIARIGKPDAAKLNAEVAQIDTDNQKTARAVEETRARLAPLLAQKIEKTGNQKIDALSVYGTFNGDSTGNGQGATLKLGNTFSTGVAAQNVTQAVIESAPIKATQECLATTKIILDNTAIPDAAKPALLQSIINACGYRQDP